MPYRDCRLALRSAFFALALLAALPFPAAAQPCPTSRTITRSMEAWYGSVFANSSAVADRLELTDHICLELANGIQADSSVDPRVKNNTGPWINSQTNIEWIFGTPEDLPAEQNLHQALSGVSLPPPFTSLQFPPAISHGTQAYDLGSFQTTEDCGGSPVEVTNNMEARVTYFELNATADVAAPAPALSEWALILLAMLLPSVGVSRLRPRRRAKISNGCL
jgi:hypothetical protein